MPPLRGNRSKRCFPEPRGLRVVFAEFIVRSADEKNSSVDVITCSMALVTVERNALLKTKYGHDVPIIPRGRPAYACVPF